jgi:hypothetical protein
MRHDHFGFMSAIGNNKKRKVFRLYAELPENKVGVSGWYGEETFELFKQEVITAGNKILKIEESFQ